jgi:hypothetical protein
MFFVLKHLLLLILVIFELKCNNLIFNEIIVLNASNVCLHAFSLQRESPNLDPARWTPHFWGSYVIAGISDNVKNHNSHQFQNWIHVSKPSKWWFYGNPLTPHECCLWTAVTIVVVTGIVWLSRRRRAEQASCKIRNQASPRFTHLGPLKLGFHFNVQVVQNRSASYADFKNL